MRYAALINIYALFFEYSVYIFILSRLKSGIYRTLRKLQQKFRVFLCILRLHLGDGRAMILPQNEKSEGA